MHALAAAQGFDLIWISYINAFQGLPLPPHVYVPLPYTDHLVRWLRTIFNDILTVASIPRVGGKTFAVHKLFEELRYMFLYIQTYMSYCEL